MTIRDATSADAYRIAVIHVDSWRSAYQGIMPNAVLDGLSVEERYKFWSQELTGSGRQTIVIENSGNIIGWAAFGRCRDADAAGLAEVYGIYLDPAHNRKGFGKSLWFDVSRRLTTQGHGEMVVWVLSANIPARQFYEAMGGKLEIGMEKVLTRGGARFPEIRYRFKCG